VSQINIWWETINGGGGERERAFDDWHGWERSMDTRLCCMIWSL
jgi:hypothetical protein